MAYIIWNYGQIHLSGFLNSIHRKQRFFSVRRRFLLCLIFSSQVPEFVPVHRHLGLLFSEILSWTNFIESVVNSAFKFKVGKKIIYYYYQTLLEYTSIVWDGWSKQDAEKVEKVQLTVARIE